MAPHQSQGDPYIHVVFENGCGEGPVEGGRQLGLLWAEWENLKLKDFIAKLHLQYSEATISLQSGGYDLSLFKEDTLVRALPNLRPGCIVQARLCHPDGCQCMVSTPKHLQGIEWAPYPADVSSFVEMSLKQMARSRRRMCTCHAKNSQSSRKYVEGGEAAALDMEGNAAKVLAETSDGEHTRSTKNDEENGDSKYSETCPVHSSSAANGQAQSHFFYGNGEQYHTHSKRPRPHTPMHSDSRPAKDWQDYVTPPDYSSCKRRGRPPIMCEHGVPKVFCRPCGGKHRPCPHGRIRSNCSDCCGPRVQRKKRGQAGGGEREGVGEEREGGTEEGEKGADDRGRGVDERVTPQDRGQNQSETVPHFQLPADSLGVPTCAPAQGEEESPLAIYGMAEKQTNDIEFKEEPQLAERWLELSKDSGYSRYTANDFD